MHICDLNGHVAPSFYAWLGFTMTALIGRGMIVSNRSQNCIVSREVGVEQEQDSIASESGHDRQIGTHRFPWEPIVYSKDEVNTNKDQESSKSDHILGKDDDFLSMMTFANQNLRQPSCLCCR